MGKIILMASICMVLLVGCATANHTKDHDKPIEIPATKPLDY